MKVRAYTIEWAEKGGKKSKYIALFYVLFYFFVFV